MGKGLGYTGSIYGGVTQKPKSRRYEGVCMQRPWRVGGWAAGQREWGAEGS